MISPHSHLHRSVQTNGSRQTSIAINIKEAQLVFLDCFLK
jgi:hypothetical protein